MKRLRIIPLDDTVVFPGMPVTLSVDVGGDDRVLLVPRQQNTYARVGVVAEVSERVRLAGRGLAVSLVALHRAIPGGAAGDEDGVLRVDFESRPDQAPAASFTRELEREYRAVVDEILELRGDDGRIRAFVRSITDAGALADTAGYSPDLNFGQKLQLLETFDVVERLGLAVQFQRERLAELQVRKRIRDDVEDGAQKQQREYFLRRQMDAIRKELGENDGSIGDEYRQKISNAGMPETVRQQAERELSRLERMGDSNAESSMIRTYLDWLLAVPWAKRSEEHLDPVHAREVLDPAQNHAFRDHYLDVELDLSHVLFVATANVADTIPAALFDRMEVIRFDGYTTEEKVTIARGHLWPRQVERNGLRVEEVTVTDAMLRRIVTDYTREAGVRQLERELGTLLRKTATRIASADQTTRLAIDHEAVRDALGRPKFFYEAAVRTAVPGVATGLAVTGVGGDVLFVEAASMPGTGALVLTGQLGDVMKESARIALTYVKSHASDLGIDEHALDDRELHVHVPAGAIPKDGPSAGITMVTAIASLLARRPVKSTVGMTGEVTLQGRVLPIGGLKQKVLAAHAAGLTEVIVPERNQPDLDDVPSDVRGQMQFHLVGTVDQVLTLALEPTELAMAA